MILRIEQDWAKYPGWFDTLPTQQRARLLAERKTRGKR